MPSKNLQGGLWRGQELFASSCWKADTNPPRGLLVGLTMVPHARLVCWQVGRA
jgi:hypothetical protein